MNKQPKPNCTCHCHAGGNFKDCKSHMTLECDHCTPSSSPLEEKILEFRKKFTLDLNRVFLGDPEELKKQGWEVGESRIVMKQNIEPKELEQFISEVIAEVAESERKKFKALIDEEMHAITDTGIDDNSAYIMRDFLKVALSKNL